MADEARACPLCGSTSIAALADYERAHLQRCSACTFVFTGLRPNPDELARHYGGYSRLDFDSPLTRKRYRELLHGFNEHRRTGRILDVGCGVGYFLEEARGLGWTPYGTEYGERAVKLTSAKGFHVVDAASKNGESSLQSGAFDVVTAFEVLEHVVDPAQVVALIARALRPGGVFYCTTPNFAALSRRLLRSRWTVIEYPEHLNYFTTRTLAHLLMSRGFTVRKVVTSGISLGRVGHAVGATAAHSPEQPSVDERVREAADRSPVLRGTKLAVNALLTTSRTGDSLKAWFQLNSETPILAADDR